MIAVLLLGLCAAGLPDPTIDEVMIVNYRSVVVRALDKSGKPIKNLKKEDFLIEVKGNSPDFELVEQDFSVQMGATALDTAETQPERRTLSLFVDASFMRPQMFKSTIRGLHQFIDNLDPNDLVRLYVGDRHLNALTPFTADKTLLKETVDDMKWKPHFQHLLHEIEEEIRRANQAYWDGIRNPIGSNPKLHIRVMKNNMERRTEIYESQHQSVAGFLTTIRADLARHQGPKAVIMFSGGGVSTSRYMQSFNKTVRAMNHTEIPLHTISFNRAKNKGPEGNEWPEAFSSVSEMHSLASAYTTETGGELVQVGRQKSLKRKIDHIITATSHQYQLTFYDQNEAATIKVSYVGPKKNVRLKYPKHPGRKGAISNPVGPEKEFETHLIYGPPSTALSSTWMSRMFRDQQGIHRIAVFGELEDETTSQKGFLVGFAALNDRGRLLDLRQTRVAKMETSFRDLLVTPERPSVIRYAVRNLDNGLETVFVETLSEQEDPTQFKVSDVVLGRPGGKGSLPLHFLDQVDNKAPNQTKHLDPFLVDGRLLSSEMTDAFSVTGTLTAFFFLENTQGALSDYQLGCQASFEGRIYDIPLKPVIVKQLDDTTYQILAELDISGLAPRDYLLELVAKRGETRRGQRLDLSLVKAP